MQEISMAAGLSYRSEPKTARILIISRADSRGIFDKTTEMLSREIVCLNGPETLMNDP
jgi:hypothetical protein